MGESGPSPDVVIRVGAIVVQIQDEHPVVAAIVPVPTTPGHRNINSIPANLLLPALLHPAPKQPSEFIIFKTNVFVLLGG